MSKVIELKIDSILDGISPTQLLSGKNGYYQSIGVDPEFPLADTGTLSVRPSGVIRPVAYGSFSSSQVTDIPLGVLTNNKDSKVYVVLANGRLVSYNSSLGSETLAGTTGSGFAMGVGFQNDYIYIPTLDDVSRYGPLSGSPTLTNGVWTGATLGSQTGLTNNTYPPLRNSLGTYPNHWMFGHVDNKLYFLDFKNNQGLVHYIKTTSAGANDTSVYNALDLSFGYYPTSGCSYGNDIVITAVQTTNSAVNQGGSLLFFWDTVDTSFYRAVPIPGVATAIVNDNGVLYIWSGSISGVGGHTLYKYIGGDSVQPVTSVSDGYPPSAGAVDTIGGRVVWGTFTTQPVNASVVYSYGSKDGAFPSALHCIARSTITTSSTDGQITTLKYALQGTHAIPQLLIGAKNSATVEYTLDKLSTTYQTHYWRSKYFNINDQFDVKRIMLNLGTAVTANMTIIPTVYLDNESTSTALRTINSTNFPNGNKSIELFPTKCQGDNNFFLELRWTGTALLPVLLPITIEVELKD